MRKHLNGVLLGWALTSASCAGFRALDRGEWVLVWTDESVHTQMVNGTPIEVVKPTPGAKQEVIPMERYESEVAEGKRRKAGATLGKVPKLVTDVREPIELMLGEVRELRIDEPKPVEVLVSGSAVRVYWTKAKEVSEWKGDQPVERKESSLFLLADDTGASSVKVQAPNQEPWVIEVTVHAR